MYLDNSLINLLFKFILNIYLSINIMSNLYVITLATKNEGYYEALKISAKRNNINLITLGWGQKWTGFMMKINLIKEYLNNLDDNDIVVCSDAYDVLIFQDADTIINKFKSFNKPIILSIDGKANSLLQIWFQSRVFDKCNNIHICAGLYMGYVWALKLLFNHMCKYNDCSNKNNDDQIMLTNTCNNSSFYNKYMAIDYDSLIFYTTFGGYGLINFDYTPGINSDIINNKLIIKKTKQEPSFVHGPADTNIDLLIKVYDLHTNKNQRDKLSKAIIYVKPNYYKYYINDALILLLIIPTFIIFIHLLKNYNYNE
jgi:hypothetical protein